MWFQEMVVVIYSEGVRNLQIVTLNRKLGGEMTHIIRSDTTFDAKIAQSTSRIKMLHRDTINFCSCSCRHAECISPFSQIVKINLNSC